MTKVKHMPKLCDLVCRVPVTSEQWGEVRRVWNKEKMALTSVDD